MTFIFFNIWTSTNKQKKRKSDQYNHQQISQVKEKIAYPTYAGNGSGGFACSREGHDLLHVNGDGKTRTVLVVERFTNTLWAVPKDFLESIAAGGGGPRHCTPVLHKTKAIKHIHQHAVAILAWGRRLGHGHHGNGHHEHKPYQLFHIASNEENW